MPVSSFENIIKTLEKKIYHPVYFFCGEEPYYIDLLSDYIENNILDEAEREFNQTVIYGKDSDVNTIMSYAKRFPMMADHLVLIVKEAQAVEKIEELAKYLANPVSTTILVICYKYAKIDKRKKFFSEIKEKGIFFESVKIYENQLPAWISNYVKDKGYRITGKAAAMLTEFLGADLGKVVNEINKLIINTGEGKEINDVLVEKSIGISKDYNIFELQNALATRNHFKSYSIARYFAANQKDNPFILTLIMLGSFFTKVLIYHHLNDKTDRAAAASLSVAPYHLGDIKKATSSFSPKKTEHIISLLREYDMKAKGLNNVSTPGGELLRELIFKILNSN
ncbi:MAG: DNA polymerase III subunit delta [Bacteroidales bacterium]|nr:DNA polymerase III subunit delta [Bacteroidales bacterium]